MEPAWLPEEALHLNLHGFFYIIEGSFLHVSLFYFFIISRIRSGVFVTVVHHSLSPFVSIILVGYYLLDSVIVVHILRIVLWFVCVLGL